MGREIKFRAWVNDGMWTVNGLACSDDTDEMDLVDYSIGGQIKVYDYDYTKDCVLMQYTGLKDKNGKEIYEGDIVYWEIDNGIGIESYSAIVQWSENNDDYKGMYKWIVLYLADYLRGSFDELATPAAYNYELQVIGNIYDSPELLANE